MISHFMSFRCHDVNSPVFSLDWVHERGAVFVLKLQTNCVLFLLAQWCVFTALFSLVNFFFTNANAAHTTYYIWCYHLVVEEEQQEARKRKRNFRKYLERLVRHSGSSENLTLNFLLFFYPLLLILGSTHTLCHLVQQQHTWSWLGFDPFRPSSMFFNTLGHVSFLA